MSVIDIILLVCLIPAVVSGLRKGFIAQAISIISLILGVWASYKFSSALSNWIGQWIEGSTQILNIIAFALIFIGVIFGLHFVGRILEASIKLVMLGWLNKLLGVIFALLKCFLILGLVIMAFDALNNTIGLVSQDTLNSSVLYTNLESLANKVFPYIKNLLHL